MRGEKTEACGERGRRGDTETQNAVTCCLGPRHLEIALLHCRCHVPSCRVLRPLQIETLPSKKRTMDKQHSHQMLDQFGPGQFEAVVHLLEVLTDSENVAIRHAPIDDEPESEEEARAVAASKEWFRNHQGIPFEEVVADLGFNHGTDSRAQGIRLKRIVFSDQAMPTSAPSRSPSP